MVDGKDLHQESPEIIIELKLIALDTNSRQVQCPELIYKTKIRLEKMCFPILKFKLISPFDAQIPSSFARLLHVI